MRVIIAGSRDLPVKGVLVIDHAVNLSGFNVSEVVSGTCRGVDKDGEEWGYARMVPVKQFPADWERFGKSAGYRRNVQMADYADALIALWDGKSKGTKHMIDIADSKGLPIFIWDVTTNSYTSRSHEWDRT